jgi:predicted esterase
MSSMVVTIGEAGESHRCTFLRPRPDRPVLELEHTDRFRKVANRYPRRVNEAYSFDIARALADDDETVAATVAHWEAAQGLEPRDWIAIGHAEGRTVDAQREP